MSAEVQPAQDAKQNDKEFNFRQIEKKLMEERSAKEEAQREIERLRAAIKPQEDEDDSEPYVDHKKLNKTLTKFGQNQQTEIQKAMETAKSKAKEELKQEMWLESNPDFYDTLQHAEKFAQRAPKLAESILKMPDSFERQKLVYENIKTLGIDKPEPKQSSVQDKIDANRRSPYYQPTGVGTAPYASQGDFSSAGQQNAYQKMQELKNRLRLN